MPYTLHDGISYVSITPAQALRLEIALNTSPHNRHWQSLGDKLYAWRLPDNPSNEHLVTPLQLQWTIQHIAYIASQHS